MYESNMKYGDRETNVRFVETDTPVIRDRRELLKIKIKSLAAEAQIIRKEEKKIGTVRWVKVPERVIIDGSKAGERRRPEYWRRVRYGINPLAEEMWSHRTKELREHSRLTGIAYGLIRGKSLEKIEGNAKKPLTEAQWARINAMVKKYGPAKPMWDIRKQQALPQPETV